MFFLLTFFISSLAASSVPPSFYHGLESAKKGDIPAAIAEFENAVQNTTDPELKAKALNNLGHLEIKSQQFEAAEKHLKESLSYNPSNEQTQKLLSYAKQMLQEKKDQKQDQNKDPEQQKDQKEKKEGSESQKGKEQNAKEQNAKEQQAQQQNATEQKDAEKKNEQELKQAEKGKEGDNKESDKKNAEQAFLPQNMTQKNYEQLLKNAEEMPMKERLKREMKNKQHQRSQPYQVERDW